MYNNSATFLSICTFGLVLTLILSIAGDCRLAVEQAEQSCLALLRSLSIATIEQAEAYSPFILSSS